MTSTHPPPDSHEPIPQDHRAKPFRFKRKRPHTSDNELDDTASQSRTHQGRHRHHHHRRRRHHHRSPTPSSPSSPHGAERGYGASAGETPLDSETAFRESLFDALADDEGADFWQGVYGQPIHTYSPYYHATAASEDDDTGRLDENGRPRLERMTDEEYVRYVREKMWEKSHGHILEERERRERARERERGRRKERDAAGEKLRFQTDVEEALRKGEERRRRGRWKDAWRRYCQYWEGEKTTGKVVWPVESGKAADVDKERVESFYRHAPQAAEGARDGLNEVLKKERVRWHPDKMQQRAGPGKLDEVTMKLVTAVFQTIDSMWNAMKT